MDAFNLDRFNENLQSHNLRAALLSNPATITWLTGYAPPIQTGPNPFEGGPALGWWQGSELVLILSDAEASAAAAVGAKAYDYLSYSIDEPMSGAKHQAAVLRKVLGSAGPLKGEVGVELNFLPANFKAVIDEALPAVTIQPLDGAFDLLRAVKSADEINKIRDSLQLCDLAQSFVASQAKPGMSEIEVWGTLKARLEVEAGTRLPILADFVAGQRTAEIGGLPGDYILSSGDPIIADIVPRLNGYWGDNAGTYFLGEPSAELKKMYRSVRAALQMGVEKVRPGVRASELDRMLRAQMEAESYPVYPHHSGHGLGASFHEEPRIVPYNELILEPGMVMAIEPGVYIPGVGGVRLEDVVLVTKDGCELLTNHLSGK
jgi:Xaa-Pro aminopeptidase